MSRLRTSACLPEGHKRDSFRCQYCGGAAPEIVLVIDHIMPVAKGGTDEILNLITSCVPCNSGKTDRALDDRSVIQRQKDQLDELNERRVQLEMLLVWKQGLQDLEKRAFDTLRERIVSKAPEWSPNERGARSLRRWLREYGLSDLLDATDRSADQYLEHGNDGTVTQASWEVFFSKIPRIIKFGEAVKAEPFLRDLVSVRALLRHRCNPTWRFNRDSLPLLKRAYLAGIAVEELRELAAKTTSWRWYEEVLERWIKEAEEAQGAVEPLAAPAVVASPSPSVHNPIDVDKDDQNDDERAEDE